MSEKKTGKTSKGAATRQRVLQAALALFRDKGFDATTMRDIARDAGMSTGATYHYFRSKEALVQAYYTSILDDDEARFEVTMARTDDLRDRLGDIVHSKMRSVAKDRDMMAALFRRVANPQDPVSIFSPATADDRRRSITLFRRAIDAESFPAEAAEMVPLALWTLQLGVLLYLLQDDSEDQELTHTLIDGALDAVLPLIMLAKTQAFLRPTLAGLRALLDRTGLLPELNPPQG